jgi:transcriptional regulator with XRE-family HTH domain
MEIGARVHQSRKQVGLSQERLAEKAKLSTGYIGGLERGERNLSTSSLARVAVALQLEIGSLFPTLSELTSMFADEPEEARGAESLSKRDYTTKTVGEHSTRSKRGTLRDGDVSTRRTQSERGRKAKVTDTADSANSEDRLLTTGAAAVVLGVSGRTLERRAENGDIPSVRVQDKAGKVYAMFRATDMAGIERALRKKRRRKFGSRAGGTAGADTVEIVENEKAGEQ